jgi:ATP-dependent Lon protease
MMDKTLETRIKKLEDRYRDLKDTTDEANSSIEDLYDTINNIKMQAATASAPDLEHESADISYTTRKKHNQKKEKNQTANYQKLLDRFNLEAGSILHSNVSTFLKYIDSLSFDLDALLEYFINMPESRQHAIIEKLSQTHDNHNSLDANRPRLLTILESSLSPHHCNLAISKLAMLEKMDTQDPEYWKLSQWLDNLLAIPFNKYAKPKYMRDGGGGDGGGGAESNGMLVSSEIIKTARDQLNKVIHGQAATKSHMLEIIARMISNPSTPGSVFAVEGVPGCGKTTLIKDGLAPVLGLPFQFISLGGVNEAAYLAGQNYTYVGSMPGQIIQGLKQAKCMNPIFYFDELDKISMTERGQEVMNLLIHLTDPAQNGHFQDAYMDGIPVDLSWAIFVFSFNDRHRVSPILLDRMEVIRFHTYTPEDKAIIIERHLIPQVMTKYFGQPAAARIKCVIRSKSRIMRLLVSSCIRGGVIKKKNMGKTSGIRTIIRRLEKAIARINLAFLEGGRDITKIKKIILTARLFRNRQRPKHDC